MSDPQTEVLERFFTALREGDFARWRDLLGSEMRAELDDAIPTEEDQNEFMTHQQSQAPESFEVLDRQADEEEGIVQLLLVTNRAGDAEAPERSIVALGEEDGAWRIQGMFAAADPGADGSQEVQRAADDARGAVDDYDLRSHTSLGGPVVRVAFGPDYGLLVIKTLNAERNVYLPPREEMGGSGVDLDLLVPDAMVEVEGHPHSTDKLKILGTNLKIFE
jgi:ketosteroid isomerase-like protein